MVVPTAAELVRVWELGQDRPQWYRAMLLLAAASPERSLRELGAMPVGVRNVRLFRLRELMFGQKLEALVHCPSCSIGLEFEARTIDLCPLEADATDVPTEFVVDLGRPVVCRPLNSLDLAAIAESHAEGDAQRFLAQRIVVDGDVHLRSDEIEVVATALGDHDPYAELRIGLSCVDCGREWTPPFDVVGFLWHEVSTLAARILEDVRRLAIAYGWSEAAILNMSGTRRRFYLERAP